ncbi:Uncharacterized protein TCAP_05844 [Tolypocladium capitatum]|uniref:Uncharacterized protein n=1 Tax=Tolypocladium capitatum TaxID=45235 RepID=A0A2K3Q9P8_9HYPO|nr:Uncharacterized protein TCAP_05844 [Tolypocladium capitatum]
MVLITLKDGAKPAHRSASAARGNPVSNARKDGPDDQRNGSKFLEAMKNPNWRERRTDGTSSNGTETTSSETSSLERTMARARHWLASSSADSAKVEPDNISNRKISASDRQFDVRYRMDGAACRDGRAAGLEKPGGGFEPRGLCGVMRRLNIDASPSREGLHVIEVTPHIGEGPGLSPIVAEIQLVQVLGTPGHGLHEREQQPHSSYGTGRGADRSTRGSSQEFEAVKPSLGQDHGPLAMSGDGLKSNLNAKNIAFQRMLKKLNIRTAENGPCREDRDGYRTGSGSDAVAEEPDKSTSGLVSFARRDKTASDYGVSYRPAANCSHRAEGSKDSDYSSDRFNSLNPKAREFLSFRADEPDVAEQRKNRGFQASCESFNGGGDSGSPTGVWSGASCEPVPFVYGTAPQYSPLMLIQPGFGLANMLGSAVNAMPCPPQPQPAPSWLGGAGMLPRPSMSSSAFQSLPARFHATVPPVPVHPVPVSALPSQVSAFGRPAPVPKPKVPNAWDQQAYEAYIEQRKAMEPGYAMECRLRQQRRARRTPVEK